MGVFWTGDDGRMAQKYKPKWNMGGREVDRREPGPLDSEVSDLIFTEVCLVPLRLTCYVMPTTLSYLYRA